MSKGWEAYTVEELILEGVIYKPLDGNHGGTHPKSSDFVDEGIPFVMASDLNNGHVIYSNCKFITKKQADSLRKGFSKAGDVLLTHKATIGRTAIVGDITSDYIMLTPQVTYYRVKDNTRLNNKFLYAYFNSKEFQDTLNSWSGGGSTRAYLGITGQLKLPIMLPPLPEQKAIAHILGKLDDKIELNRKMNQTLEQMAQALFQSWFVDFDPVLDNALAANNEIPAELAIKAEKRRKLTADAPSLPQELKNLFPNSFIYNDTLNKWIPEGWEGVTIGDLANVSSSKRIFAKEYQEEGVAFYRGKEVTVLSKGGSVKSDIFISKEKFKELEDKYGVPKKDDILLTSVGTIGNSYLVEDKDEFYFKDGNLTLFSKYKTDVGGKYLKTWLESKEASFAINRIKIGTTQKAITISSLVSINLILANSAVILYFNEQLEAFIPKRQSLIKETETLTKLRDVLLPQLISGKLSVPEALLEVDGVLG